MSSLSIGKMAYPFHFHLAENIARLSTHKLRLNVTHKRTSVSVAGDMFNADVGNSIGDETVLRMSSTFAKQKLAYALFCRIPRCVF